MKSEVRISFGKVKINTSISMIILLSPAKIMNFKPLKRELTASVPLFENEAIQLAEQLRHYSPVELQTMMAISPALAQTTYARFQLFGTDQSEYKSAIFAFNGIAFNGFEVTSISDESLSYAQRHLGILSGLYGFLRPLDRIQPYRLDVSVKPDLEIADDLYAFWKPLIANYLDEQLSEKWLINLASDEYFKMIDMKILSKHYKVITPVFKEQKGCGFKVVTTAAKKARGIMARYLIDHRIEDPSMIKEFDINGYLFAPELSTESEFVFIR